MVGDNVVLWLLSIGLVIAAWVGGGPCSVYHNGDVDLVKHNLWGHNGSFYWLPWWISAVGAGVFVIGLFHGGSLNRRWLWWLLPWGVLIALQSIGLMNAAFTVQASDAYPETLAGREYLTWLPTTVSVWRGVTYIALTAGLMALGAGTFHALRSRRAIEFLILFVFLHGCLLALAGYAVYYSDSERLLFVFDVVNRSFFAAFQYKNHWVGYALVAAGCGGAWLALALKRYPWKNSPALLIGGGIFVLLASLPLKESRAGTLFLSAAFAVIVGYGTLAMLRKHVAVKSPWWWRLVGVLVLFAIAAAAAAFLIRNPYARVLPAMVKKSERAYERHLDGQPDGRVIVRRYCLRMAGDRPLFGWGLGSFKYLLPVYAGSHPADVAHFSVAKRRWWTVPWEFAHNDWAQALAEMGIVGLLLLLAPPSAVMLLCPRGGGWNPLTAWCWAGCGFMLALAWIDCPFWHPAVSMQFTIVFFAAAKYALLTKTTDSGE